MDRLTRFDIRSLVARHPRLAWAAALTVVIVYAAMLRLDALTQQFGVVSRPAWFRSLQVDARSATTPLRPRDMTWQAEPLHPHRDSPPSLYYGDPYNYLRFGREMTSFYAAHWREPGYPFTTKVFLALLDDQDVAVSVASIVCSLLIIVSTYLLGALAFSRWVGLGAAAALAIERDAISCAILGGRDELFTFVVLMFTYVLIRHLRAPTLRQAVVVGVLAGVACLVRITSLSFVLPALACLLFAASRPWKVRWADLGLAAVALGLVAGPYVVNCWRVFGDPLHAINAPAGVYQAAEGQDSRVDTAAYLGAKAFARPFRLLDTLAVGMTAYPFGNKWIGFRVWSVWLERALSWAALLGLFLLLGSMPGRVMLVVLVTVLVPYSVTWQLAAEWRLTEVAYPFFLLAAFVAIAWIAGWCAPARWRALAAARPRAWPILWWTLAASVVGVGFWVVTRTLPALAVLEALAAREEVTIAAGKRDAAFFDSDWSAPAGEGNVITREARRGAATIRLPLPIAQDYSVTFRLDPIPHPADQPRPSPVVRISVNGTDVTQAKLTWTDGRVGSYDVQIPERAVRPGWNEVSLVADTGRFELWYVRVRPPSR